MTTFFENAKAAAASVLALVAGGALIGLGVMALGVLATFALAAVGAALLAAPFVTRPGDEMKDGAASAEAEATAA